MMKKKLICATALFVALGLAGAFITNRVFAKSDDGKNAGKIYEGIYLDSVYVGGLTMEEAEKEYSEYIDGIEDLTLTFTSDTGKFMTTLGEIDIAVSAKDAVEQAYHYGRQGNILTRYKEIKQLETENAILVPDKSFDEEVLTHKLEEDATDMITEPENASISMENGEFVISPGVTGTAVKVDDTIKVLKDYLAKAWVQEPVELEAVIEETDPEYTEEDFAMIDSVLGSYTTKYSAGNSNRINNLINGTNRISGTVLMPGEQFSVNKGLGERTEANGYSSAGQYVNNELTDGVGGGICQVSTTLYNAVLIAELQVDERYPHSLTVSYVKLGRDAAIAGDYMDFKFTNDTNYPIYISGYAGGGSVSFAIYGHDEREEGRTIDFESKVIETYEPDDPEEIKDDTLEEGKRVTEESPHTGYYVELWKKVYKNGELVDSYLVPWGKSQYSKTNGKVRVGTKKVEETTEAPANTETPTTETPTPEVPTPQPIETPTGE
ncbi:MAG: VanW family protein [Lachnospiraceae bacterium]